MNLHNIPVEKQAIERSGIVVENLFWVKEGTECNACGIYFGLNIENGYFSYTDDHHSCASYALNDSTTLNTYLCEHSCSYDPVHYYLNPEQDAHEYYYCNACEADNCPTYPS